MVEAAAAVLMEDVDNGHGERGGSVDGSQNSVARLRWTMLNRDSSSVRPPT